MIIPIRMLILLAMVPMLTACGMENAGVRIGVLVLMPIVLVIILLWFLFGRGGEETWEQKRLPDDEDDDKRDDFLV